MCEKVLIDRFRRAAKEGIKLIEMDTTAVAGYYLYKYSGDPINALILGINNFEIPDTIGQTARIIILAVLDRKNSMVV